ncbi:MAG TPA: myo-inosose-2 dehydratase [Burkholderiales bacterium]|jgi:inosose dehydratase|nr:myo-inosose-2 dehydratase [Burkholderiales bacterium]
MKVRFGIAPIAWTNSDLPELGGDTTLETCLAESREAGFSGTETGVKFPMDAASLGSVLQCFALKLVSGWFSGELLEHSVNEEKDRIEAQLATFKALGAKVLVYAETTGSVQSRIDAPLSSRPRLTAEQFQLYGRKLTALAEHMAERGVCMTYHHHMGTVVETQREINLLMENTGAAVGLLIDTGHLTYAGADVLETTRRHARRINHVHCKDTRAAILKTARRNDQSFLRAILDGVFTVPGDGFIDYYAFARVLADIGYEGWAVVEAEQDPVKAPPLEYSRIGLQHLKAAFVAAGFDIVK